MMALELGVERPVGTKIKMLTAGCVTRHQLWDYVFLVDACLLLQSYAHSISVRQWIKCMASRLRDCLQFIM